LNKNITNALYCNKNTKRYFEAPKSTELIKRIRRYWVQLLLRAGHLRDNEIRLPYTESENRIIFYH